MCIRGSGGVSGGGGYDRRSRIQYYRRQPEDMYIKSCARLRLPSHDLASSSFLPHRTGVDWISMLFMEESPPYRRSVLAYQKCSRYCLAQIEHGVKYTMLHTI